LLIIKFRDALVHEENCLKSGKCPHAEVRQNSAILQRAGGKGNLASLRDARASFAAGPSSPLFSTSEAMQA
jgi:hypothetical protein